MLLWASDDEENYLYEDDDYFTVCPVCGSGDVRELDDDAGIPIFSCYQCSHRFS